MAALTLSKIKCHCGHAWDSRVEKRFTLASSMPRPGSSEGSVCITECLDAYSNPDNIEVQCDACGKTEKASKWMQLRDLSPYVFVNISRVVAHVSKNKKVPTFTKNPLPISLPSSKVVTVTDVAAAEDIRYEAIGTLKHSGKE